MEGTIKITAIPDVGLSIEMHTRKTSIVDKIAVFDALAEGFHLDEDDRLLIAMVFATGGISAIPGVEKTSVEMSPELVKLFRNRKEKNDESDAL